MSPTNPSTAFTFLPQGGIIQDFKIDGHNIVLGFNSPEPYRQHNSAFFGENIGRVANRIAHARIDKLNGRAYELTANNGPNTLHGGPQGWGKRIFDGPSTVQRDGRPATFFKYISKDGEEGFPGTVEFRLWYFGRVAEEQGKTVTSLEIEYEVELIGDEVEETAACRVWIAVIIADLTDVDAHSYFNISGGPTIEGTRATVHTNLHQVVDAHSIPTGAIEPFPGIRANEEFVFGAESPDPDHCFVMGDGEAAGVPLDTRSRRLQKLVELYHPDTRIHFEALSTEPAFQLYAGRFINVPAMPDGTPARVPRGALCIEASRYVNAINNDAWRHMVVLKKGQLWGSRTVYRGWTDAPN
ncbi:hypothetical protein MRB53_038088 [Persea americana]|nr:hypothetical protein MRB53_038088 [Persea americana]